MVSAVMIPGGAAKAMASTKEEISSGVIRDK
jgi:hypothetical protein